MSWTPCEHETPRGEDCTPCETASRIKRLEDQISDLWDAIMDLRTDKADREVAQ